MHTFTFLWACALLAVRVPASPLTGDKVSVVTEADKEVIVNTHNKLRRAVQPTASDMLKMSWSDEAAANAQKWANGCSMDHSPVEKRTIGTTVCGENIFQAGAMTPWDSGVRDWYREVNNWSYGVGKINTGEVGHFTQVVWYRSNEIGCGLAYCPDNPELKYFYVCQYCPAGNYQYTHPYKDGPACGHCPDACDEGLCTNPCPYTDVYLNCPALTKMYGCGMPMIGGVCPASCKCTNNEIT